MSQADLAYEDASGQEALFDLLRTLTEEATDNTVGTSKVLGRNQLL